MVMKKGSLVVVVLCGVVLLAVFFSWKKQVAKHSKEAVSAPVVVKDERIGAGAAAGPKQPQCGVGAPSSVLDGSFTCCVTGLVSFPRSPKDLGAISECVIGHADEANAASFRQIVAHACASPPQLPVPPENEPCTFAFRGSVRNSTSVPNYHCRAEGPSEEAAEGAPFSERIATEALWMAIFMEDACCTYADFRFSRRDAYWDARRTVATSSWWQGGFKTEMLSKPKKYVKGPLGASTRAGYPSFQHFVLDPMPHMVFIKGVLPGVAILNPPLNSGEMRIASEIGLADVVPVVGGETVCSKEGIFFPLFMGRNHRTPEQFAMITHYFKTYLSAARAPVSKKTVVYLSREPGGGYRDINNQAQVLDFVRSYLQKHGLALEVVMYRSQEWSFQKTLDLMRSAALLMGPHGGAIANAVFANATDATLIEFCRGKTDQPPMQSYNGNGWFLMKHICVQRRLTKDQSTSYMDLGELEAAMDFWRTGKRPEMCHPSKQWIPTQDLVTAAMKKAVM